MTLAFLHRGLRQLSPDKLLFRKYQLSRKQKLVMIIWGLVLSQLASPIGNWLYFFFVQLKFPVLYPKGNAQYADWYLADLWDRAPVHIQNALALLSVTVHWTNGVTAPAWWVADRHLGRYILIGLTGTLLIRSLLVGIKPHKRVSTFRILTSPLAVLAVVVPLAGLLIWGTDALNITNSGTLISNSWAADFLERGHWQGVVIGIIIGVAAKRVFDPVAATIQLISIENHLHKTEQWWWRYVYLPNWLQRYRYLKATGHKPEEHGKWLGIVLALALPFLLAAMCLGFWLKYAGPAVGAGH